MSQGESEAMRERERALREKERERERERSQWSTSHVPHFGIGQDSKTVVSWFFKRIRR